MCRAHLLLMPGNGRPPRHTVKRPDDLVQTELVERRLFLLRNRDISRNLSRIYLSALKSFL
jgi:hypothetical protein